MVNEQSLPLFITGEIIPEGFNKTDWLLNKANPSHIKYLAQSNRLLILIKEYQGIGGWAFFKQKWIAEKIGVTVRHVQNVIAELKKHNVIEIKRHDQNYYRVVEFFSMRPTEMAEKARKLRIEFVDFFFKGAKREEPKERKKAERGYLGAAKVERAVEKLKEQGAKVKQEEAIGQKVEMTLEQERERERETKEILARMFEEEERERERELEECRKNTPEEIKNKIDEAAEEVAMQYITRGSQIPEGEYCSRVRSKIEVYDRFLVGRLNPLIREIARRVYKAYCDANLRGIF